MFATTSYRSNAGLKKEHDDEARLKPAPKNRFYARQQSTDHVELMFLRVVGRNRVPIAAIEDIPNTIDEEVQNAVPYGATMEVHKATWNKQGVVVKYIRRDYVGEACGRAMLDMNFELQLMSKGSLRKHRNIPKLIAVCFDTRPGDPQTSSTVYPGLVVEPAHERYPDLKHYFDIGSHPSRPRRLPFQTSAHFIADIADGLTALHDHDIVHSDMKPENILLFADSASPSGLVAKVADFGFVGMTTYNNAGERAGLSESRPLGGTAEWAAPECLVDADPVMTSRSLEHPSYESCIDIYSFGLLASYIALDGQTPLEYALNLSHSKTSDALRDKVVAKIKDYYSHDYPGCEPSLKEAAIYIAQQTLLLDSTQRINSLRSIRKHLFGT